MGHYEKIPCEDDDDWAVFDEYEYVEDEVPIEAKDDFYSELDEFAYDDNWENV